MVHSCFRKANTDFMQKSITIESAMLAALSLLTAASQAHLMLHSANSGGMHFSKMRRKK